MKKGVSVVGERDREKMDRDKDRRKKEKKQRKDLNKQNLSGTMSSEELLRLDEVCMIFVYRLKYQKKLILHNLLFHWHNTSINFGTA